MRLNSSYKNLMPILPTLDLRTGDWRLLLPARQRKPLISGVFRSFQELIFIPRARPTMQERTTPSCQGLVRHPLARQSRALLHVPGRALFSTPIPSFRPPNLLPLLESVISS